MIYFDYICAYCTTREEVDVPEKFFYLWTRWYHIHWKVVMECLKWKKLSTSWKFTEVKDSLFDSTIYDFISERDDRKYWTQLKIARGDIIQSFSALQINNRGNSSIRSIFMERLTWIRTIHCYWFAFCTFQGSWILFDWTIT